MAKTKSGTYWITWAGTNAKDSSSLDDLADPFKTNVKAFIKALKDAGARVDVENTKRSDKRAYLFHWCWKIGLAFGRSSPLTSATYFRNLLLKFVRRSNNAVVSPTAISSSPPPIPTLARMTATAKIGIDPWARL